MSSTTLMPRSCSEKAEVHLRQPLPMRWIFYCAVSALVGKSMETAPQEAMCPRRFPKRGVKPTKERATAAIRRVRDSRNSCLFACFAWCLFECELTLAQWSSGYACVGLGASTEEQWLSERAFNPFIAVRVGEALNPGPSIGAGLTEEQKSDWADAEAAFGCPAVLDAVDCASLVGQQSSPTPDAVRRACFIPSASFRGAVSGAVFRHGELGVGYYTDRMTECARDSGCTEPVAISLNDLIVDPSPFSCAPEASRTRRARRPRDTQGRRYRAKHGIRQCTNTALPVGCDRMEAHSWANNGLWSVVTANCNSWKSAADQLLPNCKSDYILLQETRISSAESGLRASGAARALGWKAVNSAAHRLPNARLGSGGCAVMRHKSGGIKDFTECCIGEALRHRICVAWVDGLVPGGFFIISVYLRDNEGLSPANASLLLAIETVTKSLKGPWVIGGDWNLSPETLEEAGWVNTIHGAIAKPSEYTCAQSIYDFFVVCDGLRGATHSVTAISDAGLHPHLPVRLLLRSSARRPHSRAVRLPTRVPPALPSGPAEARSGSDPS